MKKKILLLAVLMTATLVGCGGKDTPAAADPASTPASAPAESAAQDADYPPYSDFEIQVTEPVDETGYGKFRAVNNSKYSVLHVKQLLRRASDEAEVLPCAAESLLPGETSPEFVLFSEEPNIDLADYTPVWLEIGYLDEDKNEHIYRYDYKLDRYEFYQ